MTRRVLVGPGRGPRTGVRALLLALMILVLGTHVSAAPQPGGCTSPRSVTSPRPATPAACWMRSTTWTATSPWPSVTSPTERPAAEQTWCDFVTDRVGEGYPFELISGNHESNGLNGNINDFSSCLPNQLPGAVGTYGRQYYVDVPADNPIARFIMISPSLRLPGPDDVQLPGGLGPLSVDRPGHRQRPHRADSLGRRRHAQALHHRRAVHLRPRLRPVQPAGQQEGRPDPGRPRAHLSAQQAVGPRNGLHRPWCRADYDADCVAGLRQCLRPRAPAASPWWSAPAGTASTTSTPPTPRATTSRRPRA